MAAATVPRRRPRIRHGRMAQRNRDSMGVYNITGEMTWGEVAAIFNRTHGTNLTRRRIMQIGEQAARKLREVLAEFEVDLPARRT